LFSGLSRLSYARAKALWTVLTLLAVAAAAFLAQALVDPRATARKRWCFAAIVLGFHPLLTLLERGQVEGLVLLLVVASLATLVLRKAEWAGGALFALAILLKLHLLLAAPLLFYRSRRALVGLAAGGAALLGSAVLLEGTTHVADYFGRQLPIIARFGEAGPLEARIPAERIAALRGSLTPGEVALDGRTWRLEMLEFTINASLVRTPIGRAAWDACRALGLRMAPGHVGLVLFGIGIGLYVPLRRFLAKRDSPQAPLSAFRTGLAAITWAQLVAPMGWSMGTVLLLPAAPLALRAPAAPWSRSARVGSWLILAGLACAAVPDPAIRALVPASAASLLGSEYLVAQILVLVGLLVQGDGGSGVSAPAAGRALPADP